MIAIAHPRSGVRVLVLLVWISLLAGCASTDGTLAQDLAQRRWEKCSYVRTITLREIKPD